jgi:hypothetical protein
MTRETDRRDLSDLADARHHRAEIVFGVLSFAGALLLASQLGNQTSWLSGRAFAAQPSFWPVVAIGGMVLFGTFELWHSWRRNRRVRADGIAAEVLDWFRGLEFVAWFMAYVAVVPVVGYLPTTIVFCAVLTWRLGYRRPRTLVAAALTGIVTVVVFKSFLSVRIPGGDLYEALPDAVRNFMILYL